MLDFVNDRNLNRIVGQFVQKYKNTIQQTGHRATGKLQETITYSFQYDGRNLRLILNMEDYYKYLESGRKSGKFPPVDKILEWIRIKPVIPRDKNGKLPTTNQLAYLIGRKIATKGTPATHIMTDTVVNFRLQQRIRNEILNIFKNNFEKELN